MAQFGLDAIDLRWTLKDIAAERSLMVNKQHLEQLIELGLVEMREDVPPSPLGSVAFSNTAGGSAR